ncbi:MAG: STAS domain-containing protein, partial [Chloroflexota bacterium]|nr:STAS domain-containing protein [Chloroflexota bacterium]
MMQRISSWLRPVEDDPEVARQGYLLNLVLLGLAVPSLLFGIASTISWALGLSSFIGSLIGFGMQPFYLLAYRLGRRGRKRVAAYIPVIALFLAMVATSALSGVGHSTIIGYTLAVLAAGILINAATAMLFVLLSTVAYLAVGLAQVAGRLPSALLATDTLVVDSVAMVVGLAALVGFEWFSNRALTRLLHQSQESEQLAQEYAAELEESRALLERRVEERTRELSEFSERLQAAHEEQRHLWETMRDMSIPVIPVLNDVIVVPLVGVVDTERAELFMSALLDGLERQKARVAIIDITGVPMVDTMVASYLVQAAQSTRLLGAHAILVGVTPDVAETI